jgi:hypothetical protein
MGKVKPKRNDDSDFTYAVQPGNRFVGSATCEDGRKVAVLLPHSTAPSKRSSFKVRLHGRELKGKSHHFQIWDKIPL